MKKEQFENISKNLKKITGFPLMLFGEDEITAIKRTIYSCIKNEKKLEMTKDELCDIDMELEGRLINEKNENVVSGLFNRAVVGVIKI